MHDISILSPTEKHDITLVGTVLTLLCHTNREAKLWYVVLHSQF